MTTTANIIANLQDEVAELQRQLAAAQAVNVKLQTLLQQMHNCDVLVHLPIFERALLQALPAPSDDTALRQLLEAQREAAASLCEKSDRYRGDYFAALIRTMPLVIDEASQ